VIFFMGLFALNEVISNKGFYGPRLVNIIYISGPLITKRKLLDFNFNLI